MSVAASLKLLGAGLAWRVAGVDAAGRTLVRAASSGDDDEQTMAGMLLVRAGDRSVPLVAAELVGGRSSPQLVDVLASIGTTEARDALGALAVSSKTEVADAASRALRTLDEIDRSG